MTASMAPLPVTGRSGASPEAQSLESLTAHLFGSGGRERVVAVVERGAYPQFKQEIARCFAPKDAGPIPVNGALAENESAGSVSCNLWGERTVLVVEVAPATSSNLSNLVDSVCQVLSQHKFRSATFVGIGEASAIVQGVALRDLKLVRQLMLIDPVVRPHQSWFLRMIAVTERYLPLGLPFRSRSEQVDMLPFAHRLRCPTVVFAGETLRKDLFEGSTNRSEPFGAAANQVASESSQELAQRLPSAVLQHAILSAASTIDFIRTIERGLSVLKEMPAKCPQKG